jgi:glucose-1-phosphate thymidylyltransferase
VDYEIVQGWWKDTGTPRDILEANAFLLDRYAEKKVEGVIENSTIDGRVIIEKGAVIKNSVVRGPTYIGRDTKIVNSYVGPFTSVGEQSEITDSEIEYSVILDRVKIRGVTLMDSLIGNNATVEKGGRWQKLIIGENSSVIL